MKKGKKFANKINKKLIENFANEVNTEMKHNRYLSDLITTQQKELSRNRNQLEKYSSNTNSQARFKEIVSDLNLNINELKKTNNNIKIITNNLKEKRNLLIETFHKNYDEKIQEISKLKESNFLYENAIKEKESILSKLNFELKNLKQFPYFKENLREKHINNFYSIEDEYFEQLEYFQDYLLRKLRAFNKTHNKIKKLENEINKIKTTGKFTIEKKIPIINKNGIKRKNSFDYNKNKNNFEKIKSKHRHTQSVFKRLDTEDLLNSDDESDDEINFIDVVTNKNKIDNKKINVPKIDLKQIEFNKKKFKQDKEKSLSRKKDFSDSSEIKSQIKIIKKKIKNLKKKIDVQYQKIIKYEQKISEFENVIKDIQNDSYLSNFNNNNIKSENKINIDIKNKMEPIIEET